MEAGKKYRNKSGTNQIVTCILLTADGNAVVEVEKREYLVYKEYFQLYREVKEPEVRYVHWFQAKIDNSVWTLTNKEECYPCNYGKHNIFLKTDKVTCDV